MTVTAEAQEVSDIAVMAMYVGAVLDTDEEGMLKSSPSPH